MKLTIEQHQKIELEFSALISRVTGRKITALLIPGEDETIRF